jgi:hypothetical protein
MVVEGVEEDEVDVDVEEAAIEDDDVDNDVEEDAAFVDVLEAIGGGCCSRVYKLQRLLYWMDGSFASCLE